MKVKTEKQYKIEIKTQFSVKTNKIDKTSCETNQKQKVPIANNGIRKTLSLQLPHTQRSLKEDSINNFLPINLRVQMKWMNFGGSIPRLTQEETENCDSPTSLKN